MPSGVRTRGGPGSAATSPGASDEPVTRRHARSSLAGVSVRFWRRSPFVWADGLCWKVFVCSGPTRRGVRATLTAARARAPRSRPASRLPLCTLTCVTVLGPGGRPSPSPPRWALDRRCRPASRVHGHAAPRSLGHGTISQTRRLAKGRSRGACRCWVLWERCRDACSSERRPRVPGMLTPASPGHDLSHVLPWLRGRAARTRGRRFRCGPPRPGGAGAQRPGRRATRAPRGPRLLTAFCRRREVERDMPWSESRRAVWPPVSHVHTHARTLVYTHAHDTRRHRCVQVHASLPDFSKLRRPPLSSSVKNARYRSHQDLSPSSLKSRARCCRRQDSVLFSWPSSIPSFTCPTSLSGRLWVGT